MKIKDILFFAKNLLKEVNIDSANIDVDIIIAHTLNITREELILMNNDTIEYDTVQNIIHNIARRINREPISHITGKREFYGREFIVNKNVLDPRPDSETLIQTALNLNLSCQNPNILDIGTGSGCLLLTLLSEMPNSRGIGLDISKSALDIAIQNANKLGLSDKVNFIESNWMQSLPEQKFDIIISNPPYIVRDDINNLQDEVKIHEPKLALDGGIDGLDAYREIANNIKAFCSENTILIFEIGQSQENDVIKIFENKGFKCTNIEKDLSGIIRCLSFTS